jgi:hypothetical protein
MVTCSQLAQRINGRQLTPRSASHPRLTECQCSGGHQTVTLSGFMVIAMVIEMANDLLSMYASTTASTSNLQFAFHSLEILHIPSAVTTVLAHSNLLALVPAPMPPKAASKAQFVDAIPSMQASKYTSNSPSAIG